MNSECTREDFEVFYEQLLEEIQGIPTRAQNKPNPVIKTGVAEPGAVDSATGTLHRLWQFEKRTLGILRTERLKCSTMTMNTVKLSEEASLPNSINLYAGYLQYAD